MKALPSILEIMDSGFQANIYPLPCGIGLSKSLEPNTQLNIPNSNKMKWTQEEDARLYCIVLYGRKPDWKAVAAEMKSRNPRQCRERWNNYLRPDLKSEPWTEEEDKLLKIQYSRFGTKWRKIAAYFPGRSDNALRNRMQQLERQMDKINCSSPSADSESTDF